MFPYLRHLGNVLRNMEQKIFSFLQHPPKEFAIVSLQEKYNKSPSNFNLKEIIGDGFLMAVPKFRRTVEKRWKRKFGHTEYIYKMLTPKTNIKVCFECGHHHQRGSLCGNCYQRLEKETKEIQAKIQEALGNDPIEKDVIVLYKGESLPEQVPEFWQGKRIVEMNKERPVWFSKNLLQKTTQQPSDSTDVKPTDLA